MTRSSRLLLALLFLLGPIAGSATERGICPVCQINEGKAEIEELPFQAEHEGKTYGLCSRACKDKFSEDPVAYLPPVFPRAAPAFTALDLAGKEMALSAYSGKVVLLDFWATWCQPCVSAMPRLDALHRTHANSGFAVVGLSIDEGKGSAERVRKFLAKRKVSYPILLDVTDSPAWAAYHVRSVPAAYLIDRSGKIVAEWHGKIDPTAVEAAVAKLLGGA